MSQYEFKEVDAATIAPYFASHPQGSFAQSVQMAQVREDSGRTVRYVAVYAGDEIVAGCQITLIPGRVPSADITAGPLMDFDNDELVAFFTAHIRTYVQKHGSVYLTINPNIRYSDQVVAAMKKAGWEYSGRINSSSVGIRGGIRWIYVKDLQGLTVDDYQSTYAKRHRRYIRNHDPHLSIRQLGRDELGEFVQIMHHTAERRHFASRKDAYFSSLFDRFGENVRYLVVEFDQDGKTVPVAAIVFIESNGEVVSYLGGAISEYANYRGSHLLHDAMIKYSVEKGYKRYNFYGIEGDIENPNSEGYGIYEFKAKFGTGEAVELIGEFVLPIKKAQYTLFKLSRKLR